MCWACALHVVRMWRVAWKVGVTDRRGVVVGVSVHLAAELGVKVRNGGAADDRGTRLACRLPMLDAPTQALVFDFCLMHDMMRLA